MAGFDRPSLDRRELEMKVTESTALMRDALDDARTRFDRNTSARTTETGALMAIAYGMDALVARLETMYLDRR